MRPGSDAIGGGTRLPSTPHSTSMPVDELLDEHLLVVAPRERDGGLELRLVVHLRDADRRAEPRRLHEHRVAERVLDRIAEPDRVVARDGDAAVAHHLLEEVLVHRERGGRDARADVRDVRELEQPLHRPVLAERPVQDRQHDVDGSERRERPRRGRNGQRLRRALSSPVDTSDWDLPRRLERPAAVAADRDVHDVVALRIERLEHRAGGGEGDVVLARAAAREQRDAEPAAHGVVGVVVVSVVVVGAGVAADGQRRRRVFAGACEPPCGILREHDAVLVRVGHVLVDRRCDLKPEAWSVCSADAEVVARHVRHRRGLRPLRDGERRRPSPCPPTPPRGRALADHRVRRLRCRRR